MDPTLLWTCFSCTRLNNSTFLIIENDDFDEKPFIYAKVYKEPPILVLCDTGCGGKPSMDGKPADTLRNFLENYPVKDNGNKPLNPLNEKGDSSLHYLIICSHCHYDHILGLPSFADVKPKPVIIASAYDKSFIEDDLPTSSLCKYLNIPTPEYKVGFWAQHYEPVIWKCGLFPVNIGITTLHTPGHTPDELAWFDVKERALYVGDSFYNRKSLDGAYTQAIVFPEAGCLTDYMHSIGVLMDFVRNQNSPTNNLGPRVKIGCGHTTAAVDAEQILKDVTNFIYNVLDGAVPITRTFQNRGVEFCHWQATGEPRFSLQAPKSMFDTQGDIASDALPDALMIKNWRDWIADYYDHQAREKFEKQKQRHDSFVRRGIAGRTGL
jgi:glyoxylase-like metal-dependent hydrolase (beta-lactamase superfamily II)